MILTLSLAIGVNIAILSLANAFWWRPVPVARPDRIGVLLSERGSGSSAFMGDTFGADAIAEVTPIPVFSAVAFEVVARDLTSDFIARITLGGQVLETDAVSQGYFSALGVAVRGRDFSVSDDAAGAPPVVILSDSLWRSRFAADPGVMNRQVRLDRALVTVVGVAPQGFRGPLIGARADLWIPFGALAHFAPLAAGTAAVCRRWLIGGSGPHHF